MTFVFLADGCGGCLPFHKPDDLSIYIIHKITTDQVPAPPPGRQQRRRRHDAGQGKRQQRFPPGGGAAAGGAGGGGLPIYGLAPARDGGARPPMPAPARGLLAGVRVEGKEAGGGAFVVRVFMWWLVWGGGMAIVVVRSLMPLMVSSHSSMTIKEQIYNVL